MYRFVGVVEYGDRLHVVAAVLSAREHPISPALAKQYMSRLEMLASKLLAKEYGFASIDAYTYAVVAHRFSRGVREVDVEVSRNPDYSIAKLYIHYEQLHMLPHMLCNLYSSRCNRHYNSHRRSMCMLAHLFCGWTTQ